MPQCKGGIVVALGEEWNEYAPHIRVMRLFSFQTYRNPSAYSLSYICVFHWSLLGACLG